MHSTISSSSCKCSKRAKTQSGKTTLWPTGPRLTTRVLAFMRIGARADFWHTRPFVCVPNWGESGKVRKLAPYLGCRPLPFAVARALLLGRAGALSFKEDLLWSKILSNYWYVQYVQRPYPKSPISLSIADELANTPVLGTI